MVSGPSGLYHPNGCFWGQSRCQKRWNFLILTSANGQKQTFGLLGKPLPISNFNEFERLEALALGAISPQDRVL